LESINWSVPAIGVHEGPLGSGLANSLELRISAVRREVISSLDGVRHVTKQVWIIGFTTSSDGAGWLRKKAAAYLQKARPPQHNTPEVKPS
jgi:hypothetical protein